MAKGFKGLKHYNIYTLDDSFERMDSFRPFKDRLKDDSPNDSIKKSDSSIETIDNSIKKSTIKKISFFHTLKVLIFYVLWIAFILIIVYLIKYIFAFLTNWIF